MAQPACVPGQAEAALYATNVQARLHNNGNLFYDGDSGLYEVPKGGGVDALFAAGIWVGGAVNGDLRVAAAQYSNFEFFPGPLADPAVPPSDCSAYDRIWTVRPADVAYYDATGVITDDLRDWPYDLGAPVIDGDGDESNYDLAAGDRPDVHGEQTAFWVMHDAGPHGETGGLPVGVEVQVLAWVSDNGDAARHSTFYRYRVINRNPVPIADFRLGFWSDVEVGNADDDYVGSGADLVYAYNADNFDEDGNAPGYGSNPPAVGIESLNTPIATSMYYLNTPTAIGGPSTEQEYWNFMQGRWADGTELYAGGDGYGETSDGTVSHAFFSSPGFYWSEPCAVGFYPNICQGSTEPGDRRVVFTSQADALPAGEARDYTFAAVFGQADPFSGMSAVGGLFEAADEVQAIYDGGLLGTPTGFSYTLLGPPTLTAPADGVFLTGQPNLSWTSVPEAEGYAVDVSLSSNFDSFETRFLVGETSLASPALGPRDELVEVFWRVRALSPNGIGEPSEVRSYRFRNLYYDEEVGFLFDGAGILQAAAPGGTDVCAGAPADPACSRGLGGNAVFRDPNADASYFVSPRVGTALVEIERYIATAQPEDYEMRFTEACEAGACYAAYPTNFGGDGTIARVPFEVWQIGPHTLEDASDDVRMIPFLRAPGREAAADWADHFPGTTPSLGDESQDVPASDPVYMMMPDRPDGYAAFADQAVAFGGAGALWNPSQDGDFLDDPDCSNGGYYVDYCYGGSSNRVYPVGDFVIADHNGDGQTPPVGTVIRFRTSYANVQVDADVEQPEARLFLLGAPYPNPASARLAVPYRLEAAGPVRLSVYDVLGREGMQPLNGLGAGGSHHIDVEASRLAPGVYIVVLEVEGQRLARRFTVAR